MTVLIGGAIDAARFLTLRSMLMLEIMGMKRSRRPTAYSILKSTYGLRGTREAVLKQADAIREQLLTQGESK